MLGLAARERLALVLAESALLGAPAALLGLALGTALAALALRLLRRRPRRRLLPRRRAGAAVQPGGAAVYGALGIVAALVGGWLPARAAAALAPAQALKGLGARASRVAVAPALAAARRRRALALLPPVAGIPLAG